MNYTLDQLTTALAAMQDHYNKQSGARDLLLTQQQTKQQELQDLRHEITLLDQEQTVLTHTSKVMMNDLVSRIEEPVSMALQLLWGDDRRFRFNFGEYRGEPAAWREILKRESPDEEYAAFDPDNSSGGGVSDVVSLVLDLSVMQLLEPRPQGLVSRDEPGKFVDKQNGAEKARNIAYFLKEYVRETGVQFVFITHIPELADIADVAYRVTKIKEMTSRVERVK